MELAERHGLELKNEIALEISIDFRVGFAMDIAGVKWVLRIPRHDGLAGQIEKEKKILNLAKSTFPWRFPTGDAVRQGPAAVLQFFYQMADRT